MNRASLTHAGGRFVLTLVVAIGVWSVFVAPGYDRFIAYVGVTVLHVTEAPRLTGDVRMEGPYAVVSHVGPASDLVDQRLELRTHHNNVPLLIALVLATPGVPLPRRDRTVALGLALLALTHVLHFVLTVHWVYALENLGPYRVTDLRYFDRSLWQSLDNPAQALKKVVSGTEYFYTHVGRVVAPILVWMLVCREAGALRGGGERR